ncbi:hypothetical protein J2754_002737 [Halarchaeum solikamskense]|uniref:hypothetical protein n=1 Tax=Halarchaeum nitratireducens TaxID=489913 RepID=UPI001B3B1666|nr:hypothetical protein [Halarchaeum solikamskense]MBP2252391.1 hypothetical protein [Halarchaeum solikamskense]
MASTTDAERPHAGAITCAACDFHAVITEPNDAIERYRRHRSVTGHAIKWEQTALGVGLDTNDIETALDALGDEYPDGVPLGVLTAALSEQGVTIETTLDAIYDLRMEGAIYEPRDDHVLVV